MFKYARKLPKMDNDHISPPKAVKKERFDVAKLSDLDILSKCTSQWISSSELMCIYVYIYVYIYIYIYIYICLHLI